MNWMTIMALIMAAVSLIFFLVGIGFYVNLLYESDLNLVAGVIFIIMSIMVLIGAIILISLAKRNIPENVYIDQIPITTL